MKELKSYRALLAGLALSAGLGASAQAALVADLAADFLPASVGQATDSFNSGTGLSDTAGTGRWNYLQTNSGGGSPSLLTFQSSPGNSGLPAYAGVNQAGEGFAMPAISQNRIFGDGVTPPAGFLNIHPGNVEPVELVARWTAGADGLYNIAGAIADVPPSGNGGNYVVRVNGVPMFGRPNGAGVVVGTTEQTYSIYRQLNVGDTVEIAFGPNGAGNWAADETRVSMQAFNFPDLKVIANAGGNYVAGSNGQTSEAVGLVDTKGSGTWNYFRSSGIDLDTAGTTQLLTFGPLGNGGNSGFGGGLDGFNMPGVSNGRLFNDGKVPSVDELAIHPSNTAAGEFLVLRWTAGADEAGDISILGNLYTQLPGGDGADFHILVDGVEVFTRLSPPGGEPGAFDLAATIQAGSTVDFVLGNNNGFGADESIFRAYIVQQSAIPEPTTLSCLALASIALLRRRRMA